VILVYRYRVKSLSGLLNRQSRAVNYVWNYCNDTQKHALKWNKGWPSGFDLNVLTTGCAKELGLHSDTVNAVCEQYAKSRGQHRRPYLRYRGNKSLAWVPLKGRALKRFLHKLSHRIVREFDYIAVGNVNAAGLARTRMAKSVLDASWSSFRSMLAYKAVKHGARYEEVDERFSSQVCSSCGSLPDSRPNGLADLGIRQWICSDCGCVHDRDVNSARNILARSGHRTPVEGINGLQAA
jgi:IS605 OrfB family transposase